jgi:hypothetical protein
MEVVPVLNDQNEIIDYQVGNHITPEHVDPDQELSGVYYDDEYSGEYETEQDRLDAFAEQSEPDHPMLGGDDEDSAEWLLSDEPLSESELQYLVEVISEIEDPEDQERSEQLLLYRQGLIDFEDLMPEIQDALAPYLDFEEESDYEEDESFDEDEDEVGEYLSEDEGIELISENFDQFVELAQNQEDEAIIHYLESLEAASDQGLTLEDVSEHMIGIYGDEAMAYVSQWFTDVIHSD